MKNYLHFLLLAVGVSVAHAQNVTLNPWSLSAPQMTNAQIMAIPNPQPGWMVFDTDTQCLRLYTKYYHTARYYWLASERLQPCLQGHGSYHQRALFGRVV
jgi:hypothetical protein